MRKDDDPARQRDRETLPPMQALTLLTPLEFFDDFRSQAARAESRIWLQVMQVRQGERVEGLFDAVYDRTLAMGQEGVALDTRFRFDGFTLSRTKHIDGMFDKFEGIATIDYINRLGPLEQFFPNTGRSHVKLFIVDNVAYIGGMNLADANFYQIDCMLKITDPRIVDELARVYDDLGKDRPHYDEETRCTPDTSILVDGGNVGQSIILQRGVEMVRGARESVDFLSQYYPDGPMLGALHETRRRGILTRAVVAQERSDSYGQVSTVLHELSNFVSDGNEGKLPLDRISRGVHGKFLRADERVLIGSHNLTILGVLAGTEEIALYSSDPELVAQSREFIDRTIRGEM